MPATDVDFEREFEELVRDLRALPTAAPSGVRERVRALGEPARPRTLHDLLLMLSWRRSLLVLAPVCVLALVSAAVIHGVLNSGSPQPVAVQHEAAKLDARGSSGQTFGMPSGAGDLLTPTLPTPAAGRYQDYEASLTVRVKDVDTLHDRTAQATQLARSFGGYVASVDESTSGGTGQSDLVLRIPVARVEDAYFRLAKLGTVTAQHLSIKDLDQVVQTQRRRIVQLKVQIARIGETLKSSSLPADVRLRLELQRDAAKQELARVTGSNKATLREASLSRIALTLTSQHAAAAQERRDEPDRARGARRRIVPGRRRRRAPVRADRRQPADRPGAGLDAGHAGSSPQGGAPAAFGCVISARAARALNGTRGRARGHRARLHPLRAFFFVPVSSLPSGLPGTRATGIHRRCVCLLLRDAHGGRGVRRRGHALRRGCSSRDDDAERETAPDRRRPRCRRRLPETTTQETATTKKPAETKVLVAETEFKIAAAPTALKAGEITFKVKNAGKIPHDLAIKGTADKTELIPAGGTAELKVTLKAGKLRALLHRAGARGGRHEAEHHGLLTAGTLCVPRRGGRAVECGGLENRFGLLGPTRVQIPPPPLS